MRFKTFILSALSLAMLIALGSVLPTRATWAQSEDVLAGLDEVGTESGLTSPDDPRMIVATLIRTALGVLGLIAVVIVLYAGFLWMTSGGDEERVRRAKRMLINGFIGLLIILSSWAITEFVINSLANATNSNGSNGDGDGGTGLILGGGDSKAFEVTSYQPTGAVLLRNIVVQITFTQDVDSATVDEDAVRIVNTASGVPVDGTRQVSGNRITFTPAAPCPDPNQDRFCFDANTQYDITVSGLKSTTNVALSCANNLCSASFSSGDIIDTEDPTAQVTLPDDGAGVPSDSLVDVQALATDDAQVAVVDFAAGDVTFDSVPAVGPDLTNLALGSLWDTAGLLHGSRYEVSATVIDLAGNTATDSISVNVRPAACFNGVQDGAETGLDCGGDPASTEYCGACAGSSCSENADCSSGACVNGVCTELPEITAITPASGAPGTYVTIVGSGFGAGNGRVTFTSESGVVDATLAACGDAWDSDEIVVIVPAGAIDGPITVIADSGEIDATDDDNGKFIDDFNVNDIIGPGLCDISPDHGAPTESVTLEGVNFGATQDDSSVTFGAFSAGSYTKWSETAIDVTSPSTAEGKYAVAVTVNGVRSNEITYELTSDRGGAEPLISSISPGTGGIGQYITISGVNFGGSTGTVRFENTATGEFAIGSVDFPKECTDSVWHDEEIVVIVPGVMNDQYGTALQQGTYDVYVQTAAGDVSNRVSFVVDDSDPTPGLCAIEPSSALPGEKVTLYGNNFGSGAGTAIFSTQKDAVTTDWTSQSIVAIVPSGTVTGPVTVVNTEGSGSNQVNFEVAAEEEAEVTGQKASYAWSFSSGDIPSTPDIIIACEEDYLSGVPNSRFNDGDVCVNADVLAVFTQVMNEPSVVSSFTLEECIPSANGKNDCASTVMVDGLATTTPTVFRYSPATNLKKSTKYIVTFSTKAKSLDGAPLAHEITWYFVTR